MNCLELFLLSPFTYIILFLIWLIIPKFWSPIYSIAALWLSFWMMTYGVCEFNPSVAEGKWGVWSFLIASICFIVSSIRGFGVKDRKFKLLHIILSCLFVILIILILNSSSSGIGPQWFKRAPYSSLFRCRRWIKKNHLLIEGDSLSIDVVF